MPDRYAFDELGLEFRCIWCGAGGPRWRWPECRRDQHHREHHDHPATERELRDARRAQARARRARRHQTRFWIRTHEPLECRNPYCSVTFTPRRMTRIYCSDRCRMVVARMAGDQ